MTQSQPISLKSTRLQEVRRGLFRWLAPYPAWRSGAAPDSPADWPQGVGSVLYEAAEATVLIDPLLPSDREGFLETLDRWVRRRDRPVSILTTIRITTAQLRQALHPLLDLPVELVLVSHGEPVLADAKQALVAALS